MHKVIGYAILDSASSFEGMVIAVAVEGDIEDWAAYVGVAGGTHNGGLQHVAARGTKLPKDVAEVLFPGPAQLLKWRP